MITIIRNERHIEECILLKKWWPH